jgi:hypothetical protein
VDKRFFVPSHDFMAKLSHNLKHQVTGGGHALGEVYPRRKRRNVKVYLSARADYARKATLCGNTGKQELGIEFADLVLNWHEQCSFD